MYSVTLFGLFQRECKEEDKQLSSWEFQYRSKQCLSCVVGIKVGIKCYCSNSITLKGSAIFSCQWLMVGLKICAWKIYSLSRYRFVTVEKEACVIISPSLASSCLWFWRTFTWTLLFIQSVSSCARLWLKSCWLYCCCSWFTDCFCLSLCHSKKWSK